MDVNWWAVLGACLCILPGAAMAYIVITAIRFWPDVIRLGLIGGPWLVVIVALVKVWRLKGGLWYHG